MTTKKRTLIFDKSGGKCWYCGCNLTNTRWQADHFHPVLRRDDGSMDYPKLDTPENLVPSCGPCNNFKSSSSIEGFRWRIDEQFHNVPKSSTGMRQLMRMDLVDISVKPVVFWFEAKGISIKPEYEMLGISKEAEKVLWSIDKSEDRYLYAKFDDFICTLKHTGRNYLVIAMGYDWGEVGRTEVSNNKHFKLQAAEWALNIQSVEGK